jgi:hypothetical protein
MFFVQLSDVGRDLIHPGDDLIDLIVIVVNARVMDVNDFVHAVVCITDCFQMICGLIRDQFHHLIECLFMPSQYHRNAQ